MSKAKENNPVVETFEEATPVEEKVIIYIGVVKGCDKLNVRAEADLNAKVLCRIDVNAEVQVDKSASVKDFYKICTASGISGYCMKKYIAVKKQEA